MLSKKEKMIMKYILEICGEKETCLISPLDLVHSLEPKYSITEIELSQLLNGIVQDNYITLVSSDKQGQLFYCITLLAKGKAFTREQENIRKTWRNAIIKTVILAIISFVVGIILKAIF